uniref:DHC_N2 domain-containing protein n=1 Tax=Macrostomum lignano TaxID=282301 RepID=A0A1I8FV89_9PLAT
PSNSAGREGFPWHKTAQHVKEFLKRNLHCLHPLPNSVYSQFITGYSQSFRLIDFADLESSYPLTFSDFGARCLAFSKSQSARLKTQWMSECVAVTNDSQAHIEDWIAANDEETRADRMSNFFNCIAQVMSKCIRMTVELSCSDLVRLLETYSAGNDYEGDYTMTCDLALPQLPSVFRVFLEIDLQEELIELQPTEETIANILHATVDAMVGTSANFPRIESHLFVLTAEQRDELESLQSVSPEEDFIEDCRRRLTSVITANTPGPAKYKQRYQQFQYIISRTTEGKILKFISRERNLRDYVKEIEKLKALRDQLAVMPDHVPMHLFLLDCSHLNESLLARVDYLISLLVNNVVTGTRAFCDDICNHYDDIVKRITQQSETTKELVDLQKYVDNLTVDELLDLQAQLKKAAENLLFLMDYAHLSRDDIRLYKRTFMWPVKIMPLIENSEFKLNKEHDVATSRLKRAMTLFVDRLMNLKQDVRNFASKIIISDAAVYVEELDNIQKALDECTEEKNRINREELLLNTGNQTQYVQLQEIHNLKEPYERLWRGILRFQQCSESWISGPMLQVDAEIVEEEVEVLWKTAYRLTKVFSHPDFKGPMRCAATMKARLEKFKINLPLVRALCNPGLKSRHWQAMSREVGQNIEPQADTPLSSYLSLNLEKHLEQLSNISQKATKEFALEKALKMMQTGWRDMNFTFVPYKDTGLSVLAAFDEVQVLLDDHIVKTTTMLNSPFIGPFKKEVTRWSAFLHRMKDILDCWLKVQSSWLYLEPIFSSADIRRQIPNEGQLFEEVNTHWTKIMSYAAKNSNAISVTSQEEMLEKLQECHQKLEVIHKGLNDYLEQKRLFFSRFFFLSNDELLEILSETKDPLRVQPHLKKCFEGIARLNFSSEQEITAMVSAENERVDFVSRIVPADAQGLVEVWLLEVETVMMKSLRCVTGKAIEAYQPHDRKDWVTRWPGQVVLSASIVHWTSEVATAMTQQDGLSQYLLRSINRIDEIVSLVRGQLSSMTRITLEALIVIDVHARDVVRKLHQLATTSPQDFSWTSQLRYYWIDGDLLVRMVTTEVPYGFEYLGNTPRLVITPLTDRCYCTLMGALKLNLGGAPEGPAGTGKTETCKDLAKAVAKQCVVFNCSDGLDYEAMGKFFKGLAQSGAWACFDEFNRIELEVLSVIAQQVQSIQRAITDRTEEFYFEGTKLRLNMSCTIFITMNPGYAGRAELPDNLKVLFRTVSMMIPDYALIAEISLYSMGFVAAQSLSAKIVATYKLCSEQLSSQNHYDYGMRAVKSVLTAAGQMKRKFMDDAEEKLVLKAIVDINLPKFLSPDIPLFEGILSDLFPSVSHLTPDYSLLRQKLRDAADELKLECVPWFEQKLLQLYDMILVRHGLMVVGETLAGKTSAIRTLALALRKIHEQEEVGGMRELPVDFRIINPKAVSMAQLYGRFDPVSHEWTDGVLANIFREHAASYQEERKWIVFDGPVDAVWIENMNTVLDDNRKLCLMSGEIIQMSSRQNMIFEPRDLDQASPATVSRCGMVYMEVRELTHQPLVDAWLRYHLPPEVGPEQARQVRLLFNWILPPCLAFVGRSCLLPIPVNPNHMTMSVINLYAALLQDLKLIGEKEDDDDDDFEFDSENLDLVKKPTRSAQKIEDERTNVMLSCFFFAVVWGTGSLLDQHGREVFDQFFRELCDMPEGSSAQYPRPKGLRCARNLLIPKRGTVFDHVYVTKPFGSWVQWSSQIKPIDIEEEMKTKPIQEIIVPVVQTQIESYFLNRLLANNVPCLLIGPTGTSKTAVAKSFLHSLDPKVYVTHTVNFSAQTSADSVQDNFFAKLDRVRKGLYMPQLNRRLVVFVDDLNMPAKEKYGAQPPIEVLRQLVDHGFWYDRKDTTVVKVQNVNMVCAMDVSGGRQLITRRFLRHCVLIGVSAFDEETMKSIFQPILDHHLNQGFDNSLKRYSRMIVNCTAQLYMSVVKDYLPTPSRSHYLFNLRDFARVVHGYMLLKPQAMPKHATEFAKSVVRLWTHEVYRVFYDRLVSEADCQHFFSLVKTTIEIGFKEKAAVIFDGLQTPDNPLTDSDMRKLMFGDFLKGRDTLPGGTKLYCELTDHATQLREDMVRYLEDYNEISTSPMDLVLFGFAIEHVARICRVLKQPSGHLLLVGIGGSGRQSTTRLATFICDFELFQIEITKNYSVSDWREDIKKLILKAGLDGQNITFLFGDHQIKSISFMEDINLLLNTADIPNIFTNEERLDIVEKTQLFVQQANLQIEITPLNMYNKFIERIKSHLHIALCFSPIGDQFRVRLRMFPSLISCCTIDWFKPWPEDALELVANRYLDDVEMTAEVRDATVSICKNFHESVRHLSEQFQASMNRRTYVTPTSYLELIKTYKVLLSKQRLDILTQKERYAVGLEKLDFSEGQIALMQQKLQDLQPRLIENSTETAELIRVIEKESIEVEQVKKVVEEEEAVANRSAMEAKAIKDECEAKLAEAMPAMNAAIAALDTLKANDITIVKTMLNPPAGVKLVMEAVCILKGLKPEKKTDANGKTVEDYWPTAKKMLGDLKFLDNLKSFDKDNIPEANISRIRKHYVTNPDFDPANIKNTSSACEGLCLWVLAIEDYDKVAKVVAPKKQSLNAAQAIFMEQAEKLKVKQAELHKVLAKLDQLNATLADKQQEKLNLEHNIEMCKVKIVRAERLINGLGGEKVRWHERVGYLTDRYHNIVGDVLLSAGVVAYLGPFTAAYRQECVSNWHALALDKRIPVSRSFSLSATLGDPVRIRDWQIFGLPVDSFSVDNAIIATNSNRWPLLIDPQTQANKWIKNLERANKLEVIKLSTANYLRALENCLQFGNPCLIENVGETLDPILEPVFLKQTYKQSSIDYIRLGDRSVEYSEDFKLYVTTRLRNPHYLPEWSVKVTLVNFMITPDGLQDQLLGILTAKEKPALEEKKNQLILESAKNKRQLKEIEDRILEVLSTSQGNILEDETAIEILSSSRALSEEISQKEKIAESTSEEIDIVRNGYKPVAFHGSLLFFTISDLAHLESMYQYSLSWFVNLYIHTIETSPKSEELQERIKHLNESFTVCVYLNVCRSLFEKDKLLFSFLLFIGIVKGSGKLDETQWRFLLTGGVSISSPDGNPLSDWMPDKSWADISHASTMGRLKGIKAHIRKHEADWKAFYDSAAPHTQPLPAPYEGRLSFLERLIILRCLRPDKIIPAIFNLIDAEMGRTFVDPPAFELEVSFADSVPEVPLLMILSPGLDPLHSLFKFAKDLSTMRRNSQVQQTEDGSDATKAIQVNTVSLGQGQGSKAAVMIEEAIKTGSWVVLQNCHLAVSWLPELEKICDSLITNADRLHKEFRLWLTSYPTPDFPVSILQRAVKMTNETPMNLRSNLLRSYQSHPINDPSFYDTCNKPEMFVCDYAEPPLDALSYLAGECNYGGRVSDSMDRRLIMSLLGKFYNHQLLSDVEYKFTDSGLYGLPVSTEFDACIEHIKRLPMNPRPEIFGLHDNADITKEQNETSLLFNQILKTLPREVAGASDSQQLIEEISSEILAKLPGAFDVDDAQLKHPVLYEESMNTVLIQELIRFNVLINVITESLKALLKAMKGLIILSAELEEVFDSMTLGKIPQMWLEKSYPSLKPLGSYITDLLHRITFLQNWIDSGTPSVFWISGFYFTQSFLSGVLQNFARTKQIPIDHLTLNFLVTKFGPHEDSIEPPPAGAYVKGLFLEGARWCSESHSLAESHPKILFAELPVILFMPVKKAESSSASSASASTYSCPVYKTLIRRGVLSTTGHSTNFVLCIDLPTDREATHWINRGVCALCQLNT